MSDSPAVRVISAFNSWLESRWWGRWLLALGIGLLLLLAAALYTAPTPSPVLHGERYAQLSIVPFNFAAGNELQLRILSPFLAYLLFLRGPLYIWLPFGVAVLFLASIYLYFRTRRYHWYESLGLASLMAFSVPVALALYWPGYTDIASYLWLFLCIVFIDKAWLWPIFYALALLNHESSLFAAPWLVMLVNLHNLRVRSYVRSLALLLVALLPMVGFRFYAYTQGYHGTLSMDTYLNIEHVKWVFGTIRGHILLGAFAAFRLFWFFPAYAFYRLIKVKGRRREAAWLALVVGCAALQLTIAHDTTRLMGLAFPAVLFGAAVARECWGSDAFSRRLWLVIFVSFLMPNYMFYAHNLLLLYPLPVALLYKYVFGIVH